MTNTNEWPNQAKIKQLLKRHNMLKADNNTLAIPAVYIEQWPGGVYTKIIFENGKTIEG